MRRLAIYTMFVDEDGGVYVPNAGETPEVIITPDFETVRVHRKLTYYHSLKDAIQQHVDEGYARDKGNA